MPVGSSTASTASRSSRLTGGIQRTGTAKPTQPSPMLTASAVVLSGSDLERIKRTVYSTGEVISMKSVEEEKADEMKAARRSMSQTRTARFPNTLAAMRKRKQAAREERLSAEEAERVILDKEEEALRQEERLRILQRANAEMIESTDKMKLLRSKALASYVTDVREDQIALNERRRAMEKADAEREHEELLHKLKELELKDAEERAARAAKQAEVTLEQRRQLNDFITRKVGELEGTKMEGRRIAEAAKLSEQAELEERQRRRERQVRANHEMQQENAKLLASKKEAEAKAAEEAAKLEAYIRAKQKETETKAALIEAKRQEAARKARAIADKVQAEFSAKMTNEEERVAAAVAEADARSNALEAMRRARQRQMHADIASHRLETHRKREADAAAARRAAEEEAARFAANVAALDAMERADSTDRKIRAQVVQSYHLAQMADKKRVLETGKEHERSVADMAGSVSAGAVESEAYTAFAAAADALLAQEESKGHRTLGLRRAINKSMKDPLIAATALL